MPFSRSFPMEKTEVRLDFIAHIQKGS
jgi:hypothetical protein